MLTATLIGSVVGNKLINLVYFLSTPFLHIAAAPSLVHPLRHLIIPLTVISHFIPSSPMLNSHSARPLLSISVSPYFSQTRALRMRASRAISQGAPETRNTTRRLHIFTLSFFFFFSFSAFCTAAHTTCSVFPNNPVAVSLDL